jgi:hypothetical protein
LQAGEKRLAVTKDDTQFDAFLLYLMLATRVDRPTALRAIDGFAAGSSAVYTTGGSVCFRAAVVGRTPSATRNLATLLARWAKAMPSARIESTGGPVVFHSCDGGRRTPAPRDATITQAVRLAAARDELAVAFVRDTAPSRSAVCAVRVLFQQKDVQNDVLGGGSLANPSAQMLAEARAAATKCRDDADAGRP